MNREAFSFYNGYVEVYDILQDIEESRKRQRLLDRTVVNLSNDIEVILEEKWVTLDQLEAITGLTKHRLRSKIMDTSLVGLLWDKQWYVLKESAEDNGYDI